MYKDMRGYVVPSLLNGAGEERHTVYKTITIMGFLHKWTQTGNKVEAQSSTLGLKLQYSNNQTKSTLLTVKQLIISFVRQ